jgi:Protein of unknown function (DUF1353)
MSGFVEGTVVDVEEISEQKWKLLKQMDYQGARELFQVPAGQTTDFASVPRIFIWFLPRYGRYTKAAILHDYLWEEKVPKGMSRLDADGLFRQAMRELNVPFLRRWIMWAAVRWAALFKPDGRPEWLKELPRVLFFTAIGLLVVLPPVLPILLSLLMFHIMEWIAWVPLTITNKVKAKAHKPETRVNEPSFSWTL